SAAAHLAQRQGGLDGFAQSTPPAGRGDRGHLRGLHDRRRRDDGLRLVAAHAQLWHADPARARSHANAGATGRRQAVRVSQPGGSVDADCLAGAGLCRTLPARTRPRASRADHAGQAGRQGAAGVSRRAAARCRSRRFRQGLDARHHAFAGTRGFPREDARQRERGAGHAGRQGHAELSGRLRSRAPAAGPQESGAGGAVMSSANLPLRALAWVACVLAFFLIMYGSFVRLSNAGLSCPDWPTCYGRITWPVKPAAVAKADKAFPNRPVETHKTWREQTHRFAAGTLGLLVLAEALMAAFATRRRFGCVIAAVVLIGIGIPMYMARNYVTASILAALGEALLLGVAFLWRGSGWRRIAVLALAVVCFQALLGMWTVTWLLKPVVVSGHLLGGMATFALLAWVAWRISLSPLPSGEGAVSAVKAEMAGEGSRSPKLHAVTGPSPQPLSQRERGLYWAVVIGVVLLACQIFLGGWTSSNYAALACGIGGSAFPTCLGQWW